MISSSRRPLPDNTQHSQGTNFHAPGGIRTHNFSRRAAADLLLRPRGHWDRLFDRYIVTDIAKVWWNILHKKRKFPIYLLENFETYSSLPIKQQPFSSTKLLAQSKRKLSNYSVFRLFTMSIRLPIALYLTTRASMDGFSWTLKLAFVTKYFEISRVWMKSENW